MRLFIQRQVLSFAAQYDYVKQQNPGKDLQIRTPTRVWYEGCYKPQTILLQNQVDKSIEGVYEL